MIHALFLLAILALALLIIGLLKLSAVWPGHKPTRFLVTITYLAIALAALSLADVLLPPAPSRPIHWTARYHSGSLSLRYRAGTPRIVPLSALSGHACGSGTALVVPLNVENPGHSPHKVDILSIPQDQGFLSTSRQCTEPIEGRIDSVH